MALEAYVTGWALNMNTPRLESVDMATNGFSEYIAGIPTMSGTMSFEATGPVTMLMHDRNRRMDEAKKLSIQELLTVVHEKIEEQKRGK